MEKFRKLLPTILILLFELAIGILLLIDGERFTQVVFIIFGVFTLICGLITLFRTIFTANKTKTEMHAFPLVIAVILIAIGAFFSAASGTVMSVVTFIAVVYGIILMMNGILKLLDASTLRRFGFSTGFAIFSGILSILCGFLIAFNPFGAANVFWIVLGVMLIVSATLDVISLIIFGKSMKSIDTFAVETDAKEIDE